MDTLLQLFSCLLYTNLLIVLYAVVFHPPSPAIGLHSRLAYYSDIAIYGVFFVLNKVREALGYRNLNFAPDFVLTYFRLKYLFKKGTPTRMGKIIVLNDHVLDYTTHRLWFYHRMWETTWVIASDDNFVTHVVGLNYATHTPVERFCTHFSPVIYPNPPRVKEQWQHP